MPSRNGIIYFSLSDRESLCSFGPRSLASVFTWYWYTVSEWVGWGEWVSQQASERVIECVSECNYLLRKATMLFLSVNMISESGLALPLAHLESIRQSTACDAGKMKQSWISTKLSTKTNKISMIRKQLWQSLWYFLI